MAYWLYILRCGDDTLYTGITNRLEYRLRQHRAGLGAKYTRGRGPLSLVYALEVGDRSEASKEEARVKKLTREEKLLLIEGYLDKNHEKNQ